MTTKPTTKRFILHYLWLLPCYGLYVCLTANDRTLYMRAHMKGMRCTKSMDRIAYTTYVFDPNQPPQERDFMYWREFINRLSPRK